MLRRAVCCVSTSAPFTSPRSHERQICGTCTEERSLNAHSKLLNEEIESTVRITKDDAKIVYHPLKSSFRIQVDSIRFHEGSGTPYIEGKMEGILYNIENSEDSIVIKDAIFGIH